MVTTNYFRVHIFNKIKERNPNIRMPSFRRGIGLHFSIIRHDEWKGIPPKEIAEIGNKYLALPASLVSQNKLDETGISLSKNSHVNEPTFLNHRFL